MNKELKISAENALAAYNNTDANGRKLLKHLFGKEIFAQDIKERIKTFMDAYCELGNEHPFVKSYEMYVNTASGEEDDVIAYLKLRIITAALNDGWKPTFDVKEHRYYPWFYIYTKKKYEELDEDKKKECRVVSWSNVSAYAYAFGGVVYADADSASSVSRAFGGSRLAFKTRELAEYCGKQFIDIWEKFLFAN